MSAIVKIFGINSLATRVSAIEAIKIEPTKLNTNFIVSLREASISSNLNNQVRMAEQEKKSKKVIPIPKDSASFFRARATNPRLFSFTADGNLQVPEMRGEAAKIIELPRYRPSTSAERLEEETKRRDELVITEKEYDEALRTLKEATLEWRRTGDSSDVITAQRELSRLDTIRSQLRSPLRWTKEFKSLSIRDVLVDEFYQIKKLGYPVYGLKIRSLALEDLTRIGEQVTPVIEPKENQEDQQEEESFIFFNDPESEHGSLSPDTMVEFIHNSTKYNSLVQAYEIERITSLGRKDLRPIFLRTRSAAQVKSLAARVIGEVENPRDLWIQILSSLVSQHPRYLEDLKDTGSDTLVYANPKEGRWGIALSSDDPLATEKSEWKGPNILGQAWQVVRDRKESEQKQEGGYTEHGKTLEESKEQRSKVLQGYYRSAKYRGI